MEWLKLFQKSKHSQGSLRVSPGYGKRTWIVDRDMVEVQASEAEKPEAVRVAVAPAVLQLHILGKTNDDRQRAGIGGCMKNAPCPGQQTSRRKIRGAVFLVMRGLRVGRATP